MIQLYPKGQTTFTANGIELHPSENEVTWQDNGRYDFAMTIPREAAENIGIDYGMILKVSVPPQHVGAIDLGEVSYYTTNTSTKLYSKIPGSVPVSYSNWQALRSYMQGDKVTYDKRNWQCVTGHGGLSTPPPNGGLWTQISGTRADPGKEIATLAASTSIMKVKDFNATYMEAATLTGYQGYIKISDCTATGETEDRVIPAFDIDAQLFTINRIDKETDQHNVRIEAEHISYQLGRTVLGECSVIGVSPATALLFIAGAMQEEYAGGLYCGIDEGEIDADWSWKNAQSAILDPQNGLLKAIAARAIRDNLDIYIVPNGSEDPTYEVRYGVNLKTVKWTGDVSQIVTRVYPIAQNEDGTRLTLPEKHIDTGLEVPYVRPEVLDTKLKVGQKVTNSDGTEVELTETEVLTRMRQAAQDRFDVDHADMAEVTLELDWIHMPDTEEYRQYITLGNAAPSEWVRVVDGPMGVSTVIQMTGYVFDAILKRYKKTTFGDKTQKPTVSGYDIKSGAVNNRALAQGAVSGANIQAGAITAREIEANSITAEQIASKIITAQLIAAGAIRADAIDTNDLTAIQATLQIANIADARIGVADIGYAQIKDANVQNLIARDALTDRYYIDKLQVRNLQSVYATVGELVVKAANNNYYKLTINSSGEIVTTQVTPTSAEISAGVTSDGHAAIIETDLTVQDLAASNVKAINALIDKLSASRINVDELFARQAFLGKLNTTDIESTANLVIKTGGTFTVQSGNFTVDASGNVSMTGTINAEAGGTIAGWDINAASLTGNKTGIAKTTNDSDIAFWAGNATAGSANFRVTQGGQVTLTKLMVLDEQGQETEVNLRSYPLWKLSYATVKSITVDSGTGDVTIVTTAGSYSFNRGSGGSITLSGAWTDNWTKYTVTATDQGGNVVGTISSGAVTADKTSAEIKSELESDSNHSTTLDIEADGETLVSRVINASGVYSQGVTAGQNSVKLTGTWSSNQFLVTKGTTGANQVGTTITATLAYSTTTHKYTAKANADGTMVHSVESGTQAYDAGVSAGTTAGYNSAKLSGSFSGAVWTVTKGTSGTDSVSLTLSATASISYDSTTHKYTATGKARASNADRASATATSGTEAYDAGVSAGNTAGYNSAKLSGSFSGAVWTVSKGTTGTDSVSLTLSATASISYDSTTHKYTATGKARASNADRASATATSGTEAYEAGQKSVTASTGSWSNGSRTVSLSSPNTNSYSITVGNASGWSLSNTADKTAVASVTVAGKTFTNTFTYNWINHGDYNQGWNDCLAACGIPGGGTVVVGGAYYANLYVMNQSGPSRVGYGQVNYSAKNTVAAK